MTDLPELAEAIAGSWLGKTILEPTLRDIGERLHGNLVRVIRYAGMFLGPTRLQEPGEVPLKVLKAVRDAGMVCENELEARYLGGVLASSRSEIGGDDRAANLIALIGRLSVYQIRTHYIFYAAAQGVLADSAAPLRYKYERIANAQFYLPGRVWDNAMAFTDAESEQRATIRTHAMHGMRREHLIEQGYTYASPAILRRFTETRSDFPEAGFYFTISPLGIELFCSAHGFSRDPFDSYLSPSFEFAHQEIEIDGGCALVGSLPILSEQDIDSPG